MVSTQQPGPNARSERDTKNEACWEVEWSAYSLPSNTEEVKYKETIFLIEMLNHIYKGHDSGSPQHLLHKLLKLLLFTF